MHVTSRIMRARAGQMPDAIAMTNYVVRLLNENLGGQFGASIMVGGDPSVVNVTGMWDSLQDYEDFRAGILEDQEIASALRIGAHLFSDTGQDSLWKVHKSPGDADRYAIINAARMILSRLGDASAFALEAAEIVGGVTGRDVGVATAMTGDRARLLWVGYTPDLATHQANNEALEGTDSYEELFKKSADVLVEGSIETEIWQNLTD